MQEFYDEITQWLPSAPCTSNRCLCPRSSGAVLLRQRHPAEACNTGPEPLIRGDVPALKRDRLSWVDQNYLRDDTITAANTMLVAAQGRSALASVWGGGEVASADGMRFVVPVRSVHSGPNPKYFGVGRGVTWYNLISNQFSGVNDITVPGHAARQPGPSGRRPGTADRPSADPDHD